MCRMNYVYLGQVLSPKCRSALILERGILSANDSEIAWICGDEGAEGDDANKISNDVSGDRTRVSGRCRAICPSASSPRTKMMGIAVEDQEPELTVRPKGGLLLTRAKRSPNS